jgi:hypothetical protein
MSYLITSTEAIDKRKHLKGARQKCLASCMSKDGNWHKKNCVPTTPTWWGADMGVNFCPRARAQV